MAAKYNYESDEGVAVAPSELGDDDVYQDPPKRKSAKQIRHETDLKTRGVWKEPTKYDPFKRFVKLANSNIVYQECFIRKKPLLNEHWNMIVGIESAREVYVMNKFDYEGVAQMERDLIEAYEGKKNVPSLPDEACIVDNACVVKLHDQWYRARIAFVSPRGSSVQLVLSDYGRRAVVEKRDLKILFSGGMLDAHELALHAKVAVLCESDMMSGSGKELDLLKEMLPIGSQQLVYFDRKTTKPPYRMHIIAAYNGGKRFYEIFRNELEKRGIRSALHSYVPPTKGGDSTTISSGPTYHPPPLGPYPANLPTAREDEDDDFDDARSVIAMSDERKSVISTWVYNNAYPSSGSKNVGLSLAEVKAQEEHRWWLSDADADDEGEEEENDEYNGKAYGKYKY